MEQNNVAQNNSGNAFVRKLSLILAGFAFLLPVFFVPSSSVNLYVAKMVFLVTGLVVIFASFLSSVLSTGTIEIPKAKYMLPVLVFALVAVLSSVFSGFIKPSVTGLAFDLGTSGSILMLVFLMLLTIVTVKSLGTVNKVVNAFIYSGAVLALYTILGTFGASLLPASLAGRMPLFISGGIIDTAIIFGAVIILALCALNMSELSKRMKYLLYALIAFSIIFIGAAHFTPVVVMLGVLALIFFVYVLSWSVGQMNKPQENNWGQETSPAQEARQAKISVSSLVILVAAVILLLGGAGIGSFLSKSMHIQATEVRPNFETTMNLTLLAWQKNFVLGIGPNRFSDFWSANKPLEINQTAFWNSDFYAGSGFIPTVAITTGVLGLLSILTFIALYVLVGVKSIFAQANSIRSRYLSVSSFLVSLYLWVMLFLYTPNLVVLALTFLFTGLFTATLVSQGIAGVWKVNIFSNPKTNFLSVLSIVLLLIVSVAGGYYVWARAIASVNFQKGMAEYQLKGNLPSAKENIVKAINIDPNDLYWRSLAEISLADLGRVITSTNPNQITDAARTEAQGLIANSVDAAKKATEAGSQNFQNWFTLGRVYEVLASNGIQGALENSRSAYAEAAKRSPNNPLVPLGLSRLDALSGNVKGAIENATKALELKNNYTDAYYTLAQLEIAAGNIPGAIKSVEAATIVDPTNAGLYFQLGLLKYNQKDFAGTAVAMERAIALVPDYANAKYFLGLAYFEIGRKQDTVKLFEQLKTTNPDNKEIDIILTNLKENRAPLSDAPLSKTTPPVKEKR